MITSGLATQLLRFGVVGSVGFVIDAGLLWVFLALGVNPFLGRLLSFPIAIVVTWALNHKWTFGATQDSHPKGHFRRYVGVQLAAMAINYAAYSLVLRAFGTDDTTILLALLVGTFIGMCINYCGARFVVFRA